MRLSNLKNGEYAYSETTEIVYTRKNGVLMKLPLYAGSDFSWDVAAYRGNGNHFKKLNAKAFTDITKNKGKVIK